nr:reverse transcriptase domain-containing protein [Tanacetum cinerariifolium]
MVADGNGDPPVPDLWTMEELWQPSLNGRGGPIAPIAIQATNFGLKNDMIQQSIKVNGVTDDALRLYLFPHSLTHHATAWFDRLPGNSINTFEQMAKMFLGKYFPPFMMTKLKNEITNFRQRPDESLFEAWECYKLSVNRCPNHNMLLVTQIYTFYNGLTLRHRDTINAAAGGTFRKRRPAECYDLIENMTAHHNDWDTLAQWTTIGQTQNVYAAGAYQGGNSYQPHGKRCHFKKHANQHDFIENSNLELKNMFGQFININTASSSGSRTLPSNTITNPKEDLKGITTRSGTTYQGPTIPTTYSSLPQVVESETKLTKNTLHPTNNGSTKDVQPSVVQTKTLILNSEPVVAPIAEPIVAPVSASKPNHKPSIPYPSRFHDQKLHTLILMPKFGPTIKTLLTNKDKLYELARTLLNENCSAVLLKKLPEKLEDPANYNDMMANRIDVIDMACEEYSQEVLDFSEVIASGNPIPYFDPIVSTFYLTLTPFGNSDFLFEEVDAFLALEDDATSPEVDHSYFDLEGDILLFESFVNDDPSLPPPTQGNYLPQV